jgi:hypothetical protein
MDPHLRRQRLWQLLERFPRALLYGIGRAARASINDRTYKDDLIEALCALPEAALERALAEGMVRQDLQALCKRIGYTSTGSKADLAARILAALDDPAVHAPRWRPFAEARAIARCLELTGQKEWYAFARGRLPSKGARPADIPTQPNQAYANTGWTSWGDFLGTGYVAQRLRAYRPFRQARAYARALGLASRAEWLALCRARVGGQPVLPPDIPATPHKIYAGRGWIGYGDWLGTGRVRASNYQSRSYEEACAFVRAVGIRSQLEWWAYCRGELRGLAPRPLDIPSTPHKVYRGRGWVNWGQFLGTNSVATFQRTYRSFAASRAYARKLGLRDRRAWSMWCVSGNRPADIPGRPDRTYAGKGWVSWGDFLGTGNVHSSRVRRRSFAAMRASVHQLGLCSGGEYVRAKRDGRIPIDIPTMIQRHPEWKGWADFLGPSYTGSRRAATRQTRKRGRRG